MEAPTVKELESKQIEFQYDNKKYILNLSFNKNLMISITCVDSRRTFENEF